MTNLKATIKTNDIIDTIRSNVDACIRNYNNRNETWVTNLRIADSMILMLSVEAQKKSASFDDAWEEIMILTGFKKIYAIKEIHDKLNAIRFA